VEHVAGAVVVLHLGLLGQVVHVAAPVAVGRLEAAPGGQVGLCVAVVIRPHARARQSIQMRDTSETI
jgi:hypothetical protein